MSLGIHWLDSLIWGVITFSILIVLHEGGHFLAARAFRLKVHEFMVGLPGPAVSFVSRSGTRFGITAIPLGGYVQIAGMEPGPEDELLAAALRVVVTSEEPVGHDQLSEALAIDLYRTAALLDTLCDWTAVKRVDGEDLFVPAIEQVLGEDDDQRLARARAITYRGLKTWQRVTVLAAGASVNLLFAFFVLIGVFTLSGSPESSLTVAESSAAAAAAGIRPDDTLLAIDGDPLADFNEFANITAALSPGDSVEVTFLRDGAERTAEVVMPQYPAEQAYHHPTLGVYPASEYVLLSFGEAVVQSAKVVAVTFIILPVLLVLIVVVMFSQPGESMLLDGGSSIIGASTEIAHAAQAGFADYALLVALFSLSIAAFNLLPMPPLDGGRIVFEIVERIIGRPIKRRTALGIMVFGVILLIVFMGYAIFSDVARLVGG